MTAIGLLSGLILRRVPKFLRGPNLGRFLQSYAAALDDSLQTLSIGATYSNPLLCPRECLPTIAKDRGIRIYDTEPEPSQRYRLSRWLQLHRARGSHQGEMRNLQPFFLGASGTGTLPWMRIVHESGGSPYPATWHTLSPTGAYTKHVQAAGNWNWDNAVSKWSRWWCIIYLPAGYSSSFTYDSGPTYDSGAIYDGVTTAAITDWVSALKEWKAAHSRFAGLILTELTPTSDIGGAYAFDPTSSAIALSGGPTSLPQGNWASPVSSSTGLATRPPWAMFPYIDNT